MTNVARLRVEGSSTKIRTILIEDSNTSSIPALYTDTHRAYTVFNYNQTLEIRDLVWTWHAYKRSRIIEFTFNCPDGDIWMQLVNDENSSYGIDLFTRKK